MIERAVAMVNDIELVDYEFGQQIQLRTPGQFAMDHAVEILKLLERHCGAVIPDTGWKYGYGLEVAVPIPIEFDSVRVELVTDGEEIILRRVAGSKYVFDDMSSNIEMLIREKPKRQ